MSIAIATMGMFTPSVGLGGGSSGPVLISEETKKPILTVLKVTSEETKSSNLIEITSIIMGD